MTIYQHFELRTLIKRVVKKFLRRHIYVTIAIEINFGKNKTGEGGGGIQRMHAQFYNNRNIEIEILLAECMDEY